MVLKEVVQVRCPGTFGEFVQGKINRSSFLVTAPVNRYSIATYTALPGDLLISSGLSKVRKACGELACLLNVEFEGSLEIESEIPHGKGMASSSADIVAAGSALLHAHGIPAIRHSELLECVARRVEPTDGVMHAGVVCFAHHACQLIERIGQVSYEILGCILPGEIDTCDYDSSRIQYSDSDQREFARAIEFVRNGVAKGDLSLLGHASSMSAELNQPHLPKPQFDRVRQVAARSGALGVVVAHSGTAIGILLPCGAATATRQKVRHGLEDIYGCEVESFVSDMMGPIAKRHLFPGLTGHPPRHHFSQQINTRRLAA